ncbi:MAG: hypothetical protein Q4A00_00770 [Flavobacteriaceae bacterium]|nr:hypothetical protein [Flavobacteriaceae bacterium]
MKKFYQIVFIFVFGSLLFSQTHRVGINTKTPEATLDVKKIPLENLPKGQAQGVIFPHFTTEQRATFANVKLGTMIYNTTLKCLEIYTKVSGVDAWHCLENTPINNPSAPNAPVPNPSTPNTPRMATKIVELEDILPKQQIMFQDDEGDKIFNISERGFFKKNMLSITKVSGKHNTIRVKNFLPHNFKNVKIYYQTDDLQKAIHIITFNEIPAFTDFEEEFNFTDSKHLFEDEDGHQVEVDSYDLESEDYYIPYIKSEDPVFNKLETIKHHIFVSFHDYPTQGWWGKMTPKYAREYMPVIANMAYLYSTEKFKQEFMNYEHRLYDDKGVDIDREKVYANIFAFRRLAIGVVDGAEGLATLEPNHRQEYQFGVNQRFLDERGVYYQAENGHPKDTWAHEYGHVLGFNHDSNMTYVNNEGNGYINIVIKLYQEMLESGELPFSQNPYAK